MSLIKNVITILLLIFIERESAHWWLQSEYKLIATNDTIKCDDIVPLTINQSIFCHRYPRVIESIRDGLIKAVNECQHQFADHRWNCSTNLSHTFMFAQNREKAFIQAITSAGIVDAIVRYCTRGYLSDCACDPSRSGGSYNDSLGAFIWGGCSHNLRFAINVFNNFLDYGKKVSSNPNALMHLHNDEIGTKSVMRNTSVRCKCHGLSGSCIVRTCWRVIADFNVIGNYLKQKYYHSRHVLFKPTANFLVLNIRSKHPKYPKEELIYLDKSPTYCTTHTELGIIGTEERICKKSSVGNDSCDIMCCDRGYNTRTAVNIYRCNCKFIMCCSVECQECTNAYEYHTCKS